MKQIKFQVIIEGNKCSDISASNAMKTGDGQPFINKSIKLHQETGVVFLPFTGLVDKEGEELYEGDRVILEGHKSEYEIKHFPLNATFVLVNREEEGLLIGMGSAIVEEKDGKCVLIFAKKL